MAKLTKLNKGMLFPILRMLLGIEVVILLLLLFNNWNTLFPNEIADKTIGTNIARCEASMITDKLTVYPTNLSVRMGKYDVQLLLDLSDSVVIAYDNFIDYGYIAYQLGEKKLSLIEVILSEKFPDELGLDADDIEILNAGNILRRILYHEESTSDIEIVGKELDGIDGYLFIIEHTMTNDSDKYREKHLESIELDGDYEVDIENFNSKAMKLMITITDSLLVTENKDRMAMVHLDGLGEFDLSTLSSFNNNIGFNFNLVTGLNILNCDTGEVYAHILTLPESAKEYMVEREGWNNLYNHIDKDNKEAEYYGVFGIQTSKGFYCIKLTELAPDTFEEQLIELFGILPDDMKLDTNITN